MRLLLCSRSLSGGRKLFTVPKNESVSDCEFKCFQLQRTNRDCLEVTVNNFLPPDSDLEHNNNLIVSHNYAITDRLVNEARFGLSFYQLQVLFPIQGSTVISTLGLQGLDISDHPTVSAFPIFNFSDDAGNYSPIGRYKAGTT